MKNINSKSRRKSISKALRFEVFKRDSFKCQYCGRPAPEVVLQIDHVEPVVEGGTNDILNLLTSCSDCNLGKGKRRLSENAAMQKQRDALEELQERREQLEMMVQWREGLQDLKEVAARKVATYWNDLTPGWTVNEGGLATIKKWLRCFSFDEILPAMDISAERYLKRARDGKITSNSCSEAFKKITGICHLAKLDKEKPDLKELYYIRSIVRNRLTNYFNNAECLQLLKNARSWDVSLDELRSIAYEIKSWTDFKASIGEAIGRTPAYKSENEATA